MSFNDKYGPWAVIAGGSDGTGSAFARGVAERGLNVVLVARRLDVLEEVAAGIRTDYGVEVRTVVQDLADTDAADQILEATKDLEVGLLIFNAGADPTSKRFLDKDLETHLSLVQRNCATVLSSAYLFGKPMVERGRGGLILTTSGAAWVGGSFLATYGATKSFNLILGEALWAEWHKLGVDVLSLVMATTDTPSLRRNIEALGGGSYTGTPASAVEVAETALNELANGPTYTWGQEDPSKASPLASMPRRDGVQTLSRAMEAAHP